MLFLSRAHSAQNVATIKSCEIHNCLCLHRKDSFILTNEVLPSGPGNLRKTWWPLDLALSQFREYLISASVIFLKNQNVFQFESAKLNFKRRHFCQLNNKIILSESLWIIMEIFPQISYIPSSDSISTPRESPKTKWKLLSKKCVTIQIKWFVSNVNVMSFYTWNERALSMYLQGLLRIWNSFNRFLLFDLSVY